MIEILLAAGIASLFMAWTIGAGSSGSTPFAPAVGANAISIMRAGFFVGILGFAGAVLQGANVSEAIGRELIIGVPLSPTAATIGLFIASILVAIGVFTGYPIATAFTVTGAIIGVGLATGGIPAWNKYQQIATLWILTPFIGGTMAYGLAKLLRNDRFPGTITIPTLGAIVGLIIANIDFAVLGTTGDQASIAHTLATLLPGPFPLGFLIGALIPTVLMSGALYILVTQNEEAAIRKFLLLLGGLVGFSAGGSQVGLAVGPLIPFVESYDIPILLALTFGGIGLLVGSWMGAPRMIKAISMDYSSLGPHRSIAALIPSFIIAQIAIFYGIPISFNEVIVSAIIGSGFVTGRGNVSSRKIGFTIFAWIASLLSSFLISYILVYAFLT